MKARKAGRLQRFLCAMLSLAMVLCAVPFSVWTQTAAAAESGNTEAEGLPLYTQNFEEAATGHVGNRVGGWDITAQEGKATVEIAQVEGRGKVLKVTQLSGASVNTRLDYALPSVDGYSQAKISFDLYASDGAWLNSMGMRTANTSQPRSYIKLSENVLKDGVSGTALVENMEQKWYRIEIVSTINASKQRSYDVYIDGVAVHTGQADHDAQKYMGIMLELSRGAAATVMLDNVTVDQILSQPQQIYQEDFNAVDTTAGAVDVAASGTNWAKYTKGDSTVTIQNAGTEEQPDNALAMTLTEADKDVNHLWAYYMLDQEYTSLELTYDIYMTEGIRISDMGLYALTHNQPRAYIAVYNTESFVTTADNAATAVAACKPNTWYTLRIVYRQQAGRSASFVFDVYAAEKGGEETRIHSGTSTSKIQCLALLMSHRGSVGSILVDNVAVQEAGTFVHEDFENLQAGAADVLEGWRISTHARAATATVTELEGDDHGKVLKLTQTGQETDLSDGDKSLRAFYYMETKYQNVDLSFEVQFA